MHQRSRILLSIFALSTALQIPLWADTVKVGYAVITPTSSETFGLVVFETFGEHKLGACGSKSFSQTGVLPSTLTTRAAIFADADGRLSKNIGFAIVNPATASTRIELTLRNQLGAILATTSFVLDGHHQTARFITEMFENQKSVPKDFTGTLEISSSTPIAIIGLRLHGSNYSTMPVTILSSVSPMPVIDINVGGPAAVILPQFVAGGGWGSELVLANFGPKPITVRADLFAPEGAPLSVRLESKTASSFADILIPAGGVVVLASEGYKDEKDADDDSDDKDKDN